MLDDEDTFGRGLNNTVKGNDDAVPTGVQVEQVRSEEEENSAAATAACTMTRCETRMCSSFPPSRSET